MVAQPEPVTADLFARAVDELADQKHFSALPRMRMERFEEGWSAQILHVGPFSEEGPTIERLHAFVEEQGLHFRGKHHEIYLSDRRRTPPGRPRTVIRQPVG